MGVGSCGHHRSNVLPPFGTRKSLTSKNPKNHVPRDSSRQRRVVHKQVSRWYGEELVLIGTKFTVDVVQSSRSRVESGFVVDGSHQFSIQEQLLFQNAQRLRGGLVFKAPRRVHHSTLG